MSWLQDVQTLDTNVIREKKRIKTEWPNFCIWLPSNHSLFLYPKPNGIQGKNERDNFREKSSKDWSARLWMRWISFIHRLTFFRLQGWSGEKNRFSSGATCPDPLHALVMTLSLRFISSVPNHFYHWCFNLHNSDWSFLWMWTATERKGWQLKLLQSNFNLSILDLLPAGH